MAAGWRLPNGDITKYYVDENELWATFNFVFSDACAKQSTYKFGLIKSILDNLLSAVKSERGMELSYHDIFSKFAENYWNLITKHHLRQMKANARYAATEIEKIFAAAINKSRIAGEIEFSKLADDDRDAVISAVTRECKRCVIGALYADFEGYLYGFSKKADGLWLNPVAYEFMLKYKPEIEQLNYYAWAKFLEKINADDVLVRVLGKLESSTPKRTNLAVYRKILKDEFESNNCFYCGCKLERTHVDHVIPWSFVREDHLWNFVLACPTCNIRKKDKLPNRAGLSKVIARNEQLIQIGSPQIEFAFKGYDPDLLWRVWEYAKLSGIKCKCQ